MDLLLIPTTYSALAVSEHFQRYPDDEAPVTRQELQEIVELVRRFVPVCEVLLDYARPPTC